MKINNSIKKGQSKYYPLKNPLIIALDVDLDLQALKLAEDLSDFAGCFKVGPRLLFRYGPAIIKQIAKWAPVFVDFKFFDIPSTMLSSVQAAFDSGATLVTVHAQAGVEALTQLADLELKLNQIRPFKILCVTILTSFSEETLPSVLKTQSISAHVIELAWLVKKTGLTGLVCSPQELELLSAVPELSDLYIVTPGIRGELSPLTQDQKRTMGPSEAIELGASALVVGRPIIEAENPRESAMRFSMSIFS
jgi:orotidine-5'-phosphate decarboxylase